MAQRERLSGRAGAQPQSALGVTVDLKHPVRVVPDWAGVAGPLCSTRLY